MLREILDNMEFRAGDSYEVHNGINSIVRNFCFAVQASTGKVVIYDSPLVNPLKPIYVEKDMVRGITPVQLAAQQIAKQQGIELSPCYFDDIDTQEGDVIDIASVMVGCEYFAPINLSNEGEIKGYVKVIVYNKLDGNMAYDACAVKAQAYISYDGRMKQTTVTLIGMWHNVSHELNNKFKDFAEKSLKQ